MSVTTWYERLVKRYVEERGSQMVDDLFNRAHKGLIVIVSSYWNVGEAAVVFAKYGGKPGLKSAEVFQDDAEGAKNAFQDAFCDHG